jgi:uncharacterized membrane-anchored protein
VAIAFGAGLARADDPTPEQKALIEKVKSIRAGLHPETGDVRVGAAHATLHLGSDFYYVDPASSKRIITEIWGNPPDAASDVLGLVFPRGKQFYEDTWGAVVTYEGSGYVSDKDANSTDYNKMIEQVHSNEDSLNEERKKQGFSSQHLVGWAQPPSYDAHSHSLIWARDIKFADQADDTLNYDVRLLGRGGVLSLNMVSSVSRLGEIRPAAQILSQRSDFDPGSRYADYRNGDAKAAYGVAGLVAAGLGVVAAKKFGLLALLALFGKKFIVLIAAGAAAVAGWFRRLFGLKPKNTAS